MAAIRRRTWQTAKGERSAWVVEYTHARRRHRRTFKTKKAAEAWRAEMTVDRQKGVHVPASTSILVADASRRWLEQAQNDGLEPSTIAAYEQAIRLHINPFLADTKLVDLTAASVEEFRNRLRREGRSPVMVSKVTTALGGIIGHAMSLGLASRNPVRESVQYGKRRARLA